MKFLKKDGYFFLAIGFVFWALSSYVSHAIKHVEKVIVDEYVTFVEVAGLPFWGDLIFKAGTMLVIVGILIVFETLLISNRLDDKATHH